jgi:hypothetical protein
MVDRRGDLRLAQEPLAKTLVVSEVRVEDFQRDTTPQPNLLGEVHDAHTAPPQHRLDPITKDRRARAKIEARHSAETMNQRPGHARRLLASRTSL